MVKIKFPLGKTSQLKDVIKTSIRLLKIVWQVNPWLFTASLIAIIIPGIIPFLNIYIYKLVIDLVVSSVNLGAINPVELYPLIGFRVLTYFLQEVAFRTQEFVRALLWTKVPIHINEMVFKKISGLDIYYFENDKFRNLLEKVEEAAGFRPQRLVESLLFSFQSFIQLSISFVALVNLNWFFIILISIVAIPEFINQAIRSKIGYGIWDMESALRKRFHYLRRMLQHEREIKEVKIFQLAGSFIKEARNLQEKFYVNNKVLAKKNYLSSLVFNFFSTLVFIGIEVFVIFEALAKRVTIGDIAFYTGVVNNFQNGLAGLLQNLNEIYDSSLYVKTIFEVLDIEPKVKMSENTIKLDLKNPPIIEFREVSFKYPDTTKFVLRNFSLIVQPGEKIAFVGENGVGKSTIIKLLARFYDVDSGEILINGVNIKDLDLQTWYKNLGVLFQDFNRYEDAAKENIRFGDIDKESVLGDVTKAAVLGGAHPMISKFDKGYDQMLGRMFEDGIELSGGQWQKIALSRAFFRNAPVLVLDEPTAAIDAKAEAEIFNRVEKLSKDKTVIIISHRFSTVRNADKIYVLDGGKIIESGSHQELMKLNGQYAQMFNLQAKGYQ